MRERVLDLVFLIGVVVKGLDGLVEVVAGVVLLVLGPGRLRDTTFSLTAGEIAEDPHDLIANLLRHGVSPLDRTTVVFVAAYFLLHGAVKLAIVAALLVGTRRVYPWALGALIAFVLFQACQLIRSPGVGLVLLTALDLVIVWLTWREWRRGRELRATWRGTMHWVLHPHRGGGPTRS